MPARSPAFAHIEPLESRQLLSAAPLDIHINFQPADGTPAPGNAAFQTAAGCVEAGLVTG